MDIDSRVDAYTWSSLSKHLDAHGWAMCERTLRSSPHRRRHLPRREMIAALYHGRLRLDTYNHYPKHTEAIRRWRAQRQASGSPVQQSERRLLHSL